MAVIEGISSANGAEVDANNRLKVNLDTGANPSQVGAVRLMSENDTGSISGTAYLVSPETDDDYRLRVAHESVFDCETFNYTAQNTGKHTYANTTMTNALSAAGLTTNSGNITTTTTGTSFGTYAEFPILGVSQIYCEVEGSFTAAAKAPRRVALGFMTWPVGAAIGQGPQGGDIFADFGDAPIFVNPGEYVALVGKFLVGTATASQTISFVWQPVYGWE